MQKKLLSLLILATISACGNGSNTNTNFVDLDNNTIIKEFGQNPVIGFVELSNIAPETYDVEFEDEIQEIAIDLSTIGENNLQFTGYAVNVFGESEDDIIAGFASITVAIDDTGADVTGKVSQLGFYETDITGDTAPFTANKADKKNDITGSLDIQASLNANGYGINTFDVSGEITILDAQNGDSIINYTSVHPDDPDNTFNANYIYNNSDDDTFYHASTAVNMSSDNDAFNHQSQESHGIVIIKAKQE